MFLDLIHHGLYSSRLRRHSQNGLFNSRIIGATLPKDQKKACLPRYDQCKTIATKTDNIPSENRKLLSVVQCLVQERKSLLSEVELYLYRQVVSGSNNARIVGNLPSWTVQGPWEAHRRIRRDFRCLGWVSSKTQCSYLNHVYSGMPWMLFTGCRRDQGSHVRPRPRNE